MSLQNPTGQEEDQGQPTLRDCLIWLGQHHEGRLGYVSGRGPQSVVVTYALVGEHVLLRVPEYSNITQYAPGAEVRLAVDGEVESTSVIEPDRQIDSIIVTGTAALVAEGSRWSTTAALFEESWPAGIRTRIVSLPLTGLQVLEREPRGAGGEEDLVGRASARLRRRGRRHLLVLSGAA